MAVIKCKMCGGDLVIEPGATVAECEYCGTRQTIPNQDDEKKLTLFARANRLRMGCEFDKAAGIYESIVADFPQEAEAYWGLVLCKYGIEYVDDPATGKKIPTCHRSSFESIMEDSDFEQALENADVVARKVYRDEAKQIEEIRKGIIEVSGKEEPYDIFICYKGTDENGERTIDSVIAQDVYDALTEKGYRVFFSRITLEDKLGQEYEPYIFAALNSAKIMLAFGTDYEYYNAVWVKNEWSRYLKLMAKDKSKHLIPCYKGIDAYDMPGEFAKLQAQDMGKVGAIQDLMRGIEKLLPRTAPSAALVQQVVQQVVAPADNRQSAQLDRGYMALEDGDWKKADSFFENALNQNAKCAEAYLGKLMVELKVSERSALASYDKLFDDSKNYQRAFQFGDSELRAELNGYIATIQEKPILPQKKLDSIRKQILPLRNLISCADSTTDFTTVGLNVNGTVVAVGSNWAGQCDVSQWKDIVAVSAGWLHTVGLQSDGTVVAVGDNNYGQCDVSQWKDIVAVSAGSHYTVGLQSDGTVVAVGDNEDGQRNVSQWKDIVAVSAGGFHTVGLQSDGTVVAVGYNEDGQCDVSQWKNIVAVSAGIRHTIGMQSDGTVVAVGYNEDGQCDVSQWKNIVAVSAGIRHTIGLQSDGTVVAVGDNEDGQCDASRWKDIVAVSAGDSHTVGLQSDGTVVAVGGYKDGLCDISDWRLFQSIETIESERTEAARKQKEQQRAKEEEQRRAEKERRRITAEQRQATQKYALEREKIALEQEYSSLKGLFVGRRRRAIEARLANIESQLEELNKGGIYDAY